MPAAAPLRRDSTATCKQQQSIPRHKWEHSAIGYWLALVGMTHVVNCLRPMIAPLSLLVFTQDSYIIIRILSCIVHIATMCHI